MFLLLVLYDSTNKKWCVSFTQILLAKMFYSLTDMDIFGNIIVPTFDKKKYYG